jgi:hypothetical protein
MPGSCSFSFVICLTLCHPCFRTSRCLDRSGICNFRIAIRIGRSDDCDHDEWFLTLLEPLHNGHPPEATALLRKPSRLHAEADLELVSAAMASYGGAGVARSLYYYRTGEVLDYPMIRRLKNITHNSTMARGSAAQELLSELRFFTMTMLRCTYELMIGLFSFHFGSFLLVIGQTHPSISLLCITPINTYCIQSIC